MPARQARKVLYKDRKEQPVSYAVPLIFLWGGRGEVFKYFLQR